VSLRSWLATSESKRSFYIPEDISRALFYESGLLLLDVLCLVFGILIVRRQVDEKNQST
jgi:hypothetical protein